MANDGMGNGVNMSEALLNMLIRSLVLRRPADEEFLPLLRAQRLRPAQVGGPHGLRVVTRRDYALGAGNLGNARHSGVKHENRFHHNFFPNQ